MSVLEKLRSKRARIAIIGLGYVGIPLALRFQAVGYDVLGLDIDPRRVATLNEGRSPIAHITSEKIAALVEGGFRATGDFAEIAQADAIVICVPTPLSRHREPDMSFILATMDSIAPHLRTGQILSLESTTYPGTTAEVLLPIVRGRGLEVGKDFFLVYSPEREDPGNARFSTQTIPKIVGGITAECLAAGQALYEGAVDRVVPVSSTQAAELTKLLENIQRAVNIGLINQVKTIADKMGIDIFEVVDAAATKPFGFTPYYPGPGVGGHCIPIDPFYLTWKAREYNLNTHFIELAGEINRGMPLWVVGKIAAALNERRQAVKGSRILVLGITYKRDIDDTRESPSIRVMELLAEEGAAVAYHDPNVPALPGARVGEEASRSVPLTPESLSSFDCVALLTDHSVLDYAAILRHSRLIVDTRGRFREPRANVVRA